MDTPLADLRKEYTQQSLDRADVLTDPVAQFEHWFAAAQAAQVHEPNAMHLATVSADGHPTARIVLLKGIEEGCFLLYTNYESRKGQDMQQNPHVALTFFWPELERQVRVEGEVSKLSPERSTTYFHSRPRNSQLGAWVSPQSQVIADRNALRRAPAGTTRTLRGRTRASSGPLGRVRRLSEPHRVLAGPPQPFARPPSVPKTTRRHLGHPTLSPLTK